MNDNQPQDIRCGVAQSGIEYERKIERRLRKSLATTDTGLFANCASSDLEFAYGPFSMDAFDSADLKGATLANDDDEPGRPKPRDVPKHQDCEDPFAEHCEDTRESFLLRLARLIAFYWRESSKRKAGRLAPEAVSTRMNRYGGNPNFVPEAEPSGLRKCDLYSYEAVRLQLLVHSLHMQFHRFRPIRRRFRRKEFVRARTEKMDAGLSSERA